MSLIYTPLCLSRYKMFTLLHLSLELTIFANNITSWFMLSCVVLRDGEKYKVAWHVVMVIHMATLWWFTSLNYNSLWNRVSMIPVLDVLTLRHTWFKWMASLNSQHPTDHKGSLMMASPTLWCLLFFPSKCYRWCTTHRMLNGIKPQRSGIRSSHMTKPVSGINTSSLVALGPLGCWGKSEPLQQCVWQRTGSDCD